MHAFKAFDRYHEDSNFRGWIFKILTNEVFKLNQKHGRLARFEYQVEAEELDVLPILQSSVEYRDWLNNPEALADALDQQLLAALKTLTEAERAVLLMRGIGEFRYREIAETLDLPLGSVMGNLARARKKMQEAILRSRRRSVL
jgi:RNA polymerase sigma-70 factor (ECF subfamily)